MIDKLFLWLFIQISKRWFPCVVFSSNPETDRAVAIHFFGDEELAEQFMEIITKHNLNYALKEQK